MALQNEPFIWGQGGQKLTPADVARNRALATALARGKRPKNVGEGLSRIGDALLYRSLMKRSDKAESAGRSKASEIMSSILGGGGAPTESGGFDRDALHKAQLMAESGGDPNAVSPAGAQGLMQIMPETAQNPGFGMSPLGDSMDPVANEKFGRQYMDKMLERYNNDPRKALAAYNWGAGNADKWDGNMATLPKETRDYINRIMPQSNQQVAQAPQGPDRNQIMKLLNNPWASKGQQSVANALLKQQMGREQLQEQRGYDRGQLLDKRQYEAGLLNEQRAYDQANPKPTTAIQNFEYGSQNPGFFERQDARRRAGATNITNTVGGAPAVPEYNKLPSGFVYKRGPDGQILIDDSGVPTAAPITGGPASIEAQEAATAEQNKQQVTARAGNIVMEDIDRTVEGIKQGTLPTTGFWGEIVANFGGTKAHDVKKLLTTIGGNVGFDRLQQMRDSSKTGGALGAINKTEMDLLQSVMGSLAQSQSEGQLLHNLERLKQVYSGILRKAGAYPNASQFGFGDGTEELNDDALLEKYK